MNKRRARLWERDVLEDAWGRLTMVLVNMVKADQGSDHRPVVFRSNATTTFAYPSTNI